MLNVNNVILVGRLTREPELRKTQSNISVCSFTIACNRNYSANSGKPEADFISCIAWRQSAEFLAKYAHKGDYVALEGRIQTRSYDGKDGKKVYVTEVYADHVCVDGSRTVPNQAAENVASYQHEEVPAYESEEYGEQLSLAPNDLPFY